MQQIEELLSTADGRNRPPVEKAQDIVDIDAWRAELRVFFDQVSAELERFTDSLRAAESARQPIEPPTPGADHAPAAVEEPTARRDSVKENKADGGSEDRLAALKRRIAEKLENRRDAEGTVTEMEGSGTRADG